MARAVRVEFRGAFYHLMARGDSSGADCAGRRGSSDLRPRAGGSQRAEQVSGARLRADEQPLPSSFGNPPSQSFPGYEMAAERLHAEDQYPTRALGPSLWRPLQSDPGRAGKPLPDAARFHSPQSGAGGDCCGEGWPRILCLETPWLETATGLEVCECGDTAGGRREFLDLLERRVDWHNPRLAGTTFPEGNGQPQLAVYSSLRRGWLFGSEHFREKLLRMLAKRPTRIEKANGYHGPQLNDFAEKRARALIQAALEHFGTDLATLRRARKGDWRKGLLAAMIQKETTMRLDWITEQLNMGTRAGTCRLAAEARKRLAADRALRKEIETIAKTAILNG